MSKKPRCSKNSRNEVSYRDPQTGRFLTGRHWRPHRVFRERSYLLEQYVKKQRSASDIAKEHAVTEGAVLFWLDKCGITRRTVAQARAVKHWGAAGKANPMYGRCGSQNPRWIDGSSPERQRLYARSFWKELVICVYRRDGFRCQKCGGKHEKRRRLHAHHIKPWAGNPRSRFDLDNLVTLCGECHGWVHSKQNESGIFLSH